MLTPTSLKISPSVSNSPESLFFLSHFLNDWNFLEIEKSRPTKVLALKAQLGHTRNNLRSNCVAVWDKFQANSTPFGKISADLQVYIFARSNTKSSLCLIKAALHCDKTKDK